MITTEKVLDAAVAMFLLATGDVSLFVTVAALGRGTLSDALEAEVDFWMTGEEFSVGLGAGDCMSDPR